MLSINFTRPDSPIKDSYRNNSFSKKSLQIKSQLNAPKDTFTKQIAFGNNLPSNFEANMLPNLKLAMKNALSGLYKKTTKKGQTLEIEVLKGRIVNETRTYKSGKKSIYSYKYDKKGTLREYVTKYSDGLIVTEKFNKNAKIISEVAKSPTGKNVLNYYNNNEALIKTIEKYKKGNTITTHYDDNEKIIKNIETDKKGTIVESTEYYYHANGKLAEMTTRFAKNGMYTEKYNDKYILISSEAIQGNTSQKRIYDENNYLMHQIEKMGNGSFYQTDYWEHGGIKKFTAIHRGLTLTEDYSSKGIRTHASRIFRGNNFDAYTNNNGILANGIYRTKDGENFNVSYNEMGAFEDLIDKNGKVVDSYDFLRWYEETEPKDIEIAKHAQLDIPDAYPDDYELTLFEHLKFPQNDKPEKELISEDKPSIIKEYLLNKFKPANEILHSKDDSFNLHKN